MSESLELAASVLGELRRHGARGALVGSLAAGLRGAPGVPGDVEILLDAGSDPEVERLGFSMRRLGLGVVARAEDAQRGRIVSLLLRGHDPTLAGPSVRLWAAGSEAERDVVAAAAAVEVDGGGTLPVALRGHLLALAVRAHASGASRAAEPIDALLRVASPADLEQARALLAGLDAEPGSAGDLTAALDALLRRHGPRWTR